MKSEAFTTEQLMDRWEDQRDIKNLMGIYANYIILNKDADVVADLWSQRGDLCYGVNDGWYAGREAVAGYYRAVRERNELVARCLQEKFPQEIGGKTADEIFGIGTFRVYPVSCPVIEIARDGETAKGLWYCQGSHAEVLGCGPTSMWSWGYYAADFIREGDAWKIWHLQFTNDVDARCGQDWGKPIAPLPELPEFDALRAYSLPAPTVAECLRRRYSTDRPLTPAPRIPEPYGTFGETFSYGI